ncbi:DnaJ domain [Dillenia turbinata]|uniref:DnaJ domain n=1 Tax=Dillenia turbinata TaxID=194707 RepID=A0AAN8YVM0_9MAGN
MASGDDDMKNVDLYAVLGLKKECTALELRNAYKKLALRWHPDRCSAPGNSKFVEEAKTKFQAIQQAYAVLSDENKRFMYDVGVYDSDDDENGMGDFLNEMAAMMTQTKPGENGEESFEELQELFKEMFHRDIEALGSDTVTMPSCSSTSYTHSSEVSGSGNKRNSSDMISGMSRMDSCSAFDTNFSDGWKPREIAGLGEGQEEFKEDQISVRMVGNRRFPTVRKDEIFQLST